MCCCLSWNVLDFMCLLYCILYPKSDNAVVKFLERFHLKKQSGLGHFVVIIMIFIIIFIFIIIIIIIIMIIILGGSSGSAVGHRTLRDISSPGTDLCNLPSNAAWCSKIQCNAVKDTVRNVLRNSSQCTGCFFSVTRRSRSDGSEWVTGR